MNGPDRYYRVSPRIWLEDWTDDARTVAFYVLTSPHRTTEGLFRMPLDYAATDMGWTRKRFDKAFSELLTDGFVEYDWNTSVCLIVNALRYQSPQNPNQVKAAVKAIGQLPPTGLLDRFRTLAETVCEPLAERLTERFGQRVANTPSPSPSPRSESGAMSEVADSAATLSVTKLAGRRVA